MSNIILLFKLQFKFQFVSNALNISSSHKTITGESNPFRTYFSACQGETLTPKYLIPRFLTTLQYTMVYVYKLNIFILYV